MRYIPISPSDEEKMLAETELTRIDDLFQSIPDACRMTGSLNLPAGQSEAEVERRLTQWAGENKAPVSFLGAGAYQHFIPSVVEQLAGRAEFFTAYTPYQPEISQGTLQAIFEYQTMLAGLTGQEVSNASLYDGATAVAEAALLASRVNGRKKLILSSALHPEYINVLRTYLQNTDIEMILIPWTSAGRTDSDALKAAATEDASAVLVQSPNFFGVIEDLQAVGEARSDPATLFIVAVTEAVSLGMLEPPGSFGADLVAGEAQSFGVSISFGGPTLGFMTGSDRFKRQIPGRLVGRTEDLQGRRAFVLTLSTREQHIRREKATSNICTNSGLNALAAAIYLASLGPHGLQEVARHNRMKAIYARNLLARIPGVTLEFSGPTFNEFVIALPCAAARPLARLAENGIVPGLALNRYFPSMDRHLLVCVTEVHERAAIDSMALALKEAVS